jgi:ABC-2 type transport system ATP-binding protein
VEPAILIQNLVKRYGAIEAVAGVSFDVQPGEVFGLLGPNGAGKTTTLECIIGLRRPDGGSIRLANIDAIANPAQAKRIIGAQLQATALQDKITPRQALKLFGSFYENPADVSQLLEQFDLNEKADKPFDTLSGGQRQRLAIALALVNQPQIVFLDEPTAGLDPQSRRDLHATIARLRAAGRTILLTTHYIEEAQKLCDRLAIIDRGKIVAIGKPQELIAAAKTQPTLVVATARPISQSQAENLTGVARAAQVNNHWRLNTSSVTQTILSLAHLVDSEKNELIDLQIHQPSLEDVFLELTGSQLRE